MATQTANQPRPGTGVIGPVRFAYLTAFKPRENAMRGGEMEYSVVALIPKLPNEYCKDPKAIGKRVQELIQEALAAKFTAAPPKWETCLKDGDKETNSDGQPKHPGYWFIPARCGAEYPPLCVDGHQQAVTGGWTSGDWGNVKLSFFGYEFQGKKGVSAGLRGIQFLFHDEPFGGGGTRADEFPVVENAQGPIATGDGTDGQPADDGFDPFA